MTGKLMYLTLLCCFFLFVPKVLALQVCFLPDTLQITTAGEFDVNLNVCQENEGFRGFKVYVKYDPALVKFIRAEKGALMTGFNNYWWTVVAENESVVRVECIVLGAGLSINHSGTILNLKFEGSKDGVQNIDIEKQEFYQSQTGAILPDVAVKSGMIIINQARLPVVIDPTVQNVKAFYARLGGNVLVTGGSPIIERGVIWSPEETPSISNYLGKGISSGQTGIFSVDATKLFPGTTYYFRAYAKSARGIAYSAVSTFETTGGSLPVELATFSASRQNGAVYLTWKTLSESNNYGFEVERMNPVTGPDSWECVGFVAGYGNSNSIRGYEFCDKSPLAGTTHYRLRQIDTDGTFSLSEVVTVQKVTGTFRLLQNFPNPFNSTTTIQYEIPADSFVQISLYNICGQQIQTLFAGEQSAGAHELHFDAENLASGMYWYRLEAGDFSEIRRFSLVK